MFLCGDSRRSRRFHFEKQLQTRNSYFTRSYDSLIDAHAFFLSAANRRNVKSALETTLSGVTVTFLTMAAFYRIANDPAGSEYTGGYVQGCIALPEALLVANKHRRAHHRLGQSGTRYWRDPSLNLDRLSKEWMVTTMVASAAISSYIDTLFVILARGSRPFLGETMFV